VLNPKIIANLHATSHIQDRCLQAKRKKIVFEKSSSIKKEIYLLSGQIKKRFLAFKIQFSWRANSKKVFKYSADKKGSLSFKWQMKNDFF